MPTKTFLKLKADKREIIMRTAVREFVKNGYFRTKVSDIAANAGISKGSVFQYFKDKRELFNYCAEWGLDTFMKRLDARSDFRGIDIFEYMRRNMGRFELLQEERELAAFMQIIMNEPGMFDDVMERLYKAGDIYTRQFIQNGKRKGTVRADIDDDILIEFIYAVSEKFKRRWFRLYLPDITAEIDPKTRRVMMKEIKQMQELLKTGMGS